MNAIDVNELDSEPFGHAAYLTRLYCRKNQRVTLSVYLCMGGLLLFYCSIDIAKRNHEASVIDAEGKPLLDSVTIINTQKGCTKLFSPNEPAATSRNSFSFFSLNRP